MSKYHQKIYHTVKTFDFHDSLSKEKVPYLETYCNSQYNQEQVNLNSGIIVLTIYYHQ